MDGMSACVGQIEVVQVEKCPPSSCEDYSGAGGRRSPKLTRLEYSNRQSLAKPLGSKRARGRQISQPISRSEDRNSCISDLSPLVSRNSCTATVAPDYMRLPTEFLCLCRHRPYTTYVPYRRNFLT